MHPLSRMEQLGIAIISRPHHHFIFIGMLINKALLQCFLRLLMRIIRHCATLLQGNKLLMITLWAVEKCGFHIFWLWDIWQGAFVDL